MKYYAVAAIAALGAALSGCATIVNGTQESVSIATTPVQDAKCTLTNSQGTWYVNTPGSVEVHKTKTDLHITCKKDGYQDGEAVALSKFGAATLGNIIAGGVIGIGIDAASGANYYYDSPITVPLGAPMTAVNMAPYTPSPSTPAAAPAASSGTASK